MRDKRISVLVLQIDLQVNVFFCRGWPDGFVQVEKDQSKEENGEKVLQRKHDDNEPAAPVQKPRLEPDERLRDAEH